MGGAAVAEAEAVAEVAVQVLLLEETEALENRDMAMAEMVAAEDLQIQQEQEELEEQIQTMEVLEEILLAAVEDLEIMEQALKEVMLLGLQEQTTLLILVALAVALAEHMD